MTALSIPVATPARAIATPLPLTGRQAIFEGLLTRIIDAGEDSTVTTALRPTEAVLASSVVALPKPGEAVTLPRSVGERLAVWVGLRGVSPSADMIEAHLLIEGSVQLFTLEAAVVDARRTVEVAATDVEEAAADALFAELTAHQRTRDDHETWTNTLVEDAHHYADENDLCERFDSFMRKHDLPARTRDYDLRVTVTATLVVSREAGSVEEAISDLTTEDVWAAMSRHSIDDWEAEEDY